MRQQIQLELALEPAGKGEARTPALEGCEARAAAPITENPAAIGPSMEAIVERDNVRKALAQVRRNKGAPGTDDMSVDDLGVHLKDHWLEIKAQLLAGSYRPQPVRRMEIPKPTGGVRALGIPTVLDRFIQQAVLQRLQADWDPTFSPASYGFRPGHSAHQAVARAQEYIAAGYGWVVDIDLEKFVDRVNHDILMGLVAKRVSDRRLLRLIRGFLTAGVLAQGLVGPTDEGTPQGGPLSPLLSNLVLDVLDKELERRGHRFVRGACPRAAQSADPGADDCNIYVRSRRAGERVMASVEQFLTRRLKLWVNPAKSAVDQPERRKFLGFSFKTGAVPKRRIASSALDRFKERVRGLTRRSGGTSLNAIIKSLAPYLLGWRGYFGFSELPSELRHLDQWIRRRLRALVWKQWKRGRKRYQELRRRGVDHDLAARAAGSGHGPWRMALTPAMHVALPNAFFTALGLPSLVVRAA